MTKSNLRERIFWFIVLGQKGVHSGVARVLETSSRYGGWSRQLAERSHLDPQTQSRVIELEVGETTFPKNLPPVTYCLHQGCNRPLKAILTGNQVFRYPRLRFFFLSLFSHFIQTTTSSLSSNLKSFFLSFPGSWDYSSPLSWFRKVLKLRKSDSLIILQESM